MPKEPINLTRDERWALRRVSAIAKAHSLDALYADIDFQALEAAVKKLESGAHE